MESIIKEIRAELNKIDNEAKWLLTRVESSDAGENVEKIAEYTRDEINMMTAAIRTLLRG